jgi:hypothetical protein
MSKKVKSYYLDEWVIGEIGGRALVDNRGRSDWLNLFLKKQFEGEGDILPKSVTTQKPITKKPVYSDNKEFDLVWDMYGKKGNRKTSLLKFSKMKDSDKKLMSGHLPEYVKSKPEKQYRKNLETYINQECWNDEIEDNQNERTQANIRNYETPTDRARRAGEELLRQQHANAENRTLI